LVFHLERETTIIEPHSRSVSIRAHYAAGPVLGGASFAEIEAVRLSRESSGLRLRLMLLDGRGIDLGGFDAETAAMHAAWAVADLTRCRIELDLPNKGPAVPAPAPLLDQRALDAIDSPTGRLDRPPVVPSSAASTEEELDTDPPGGLRKLWQRAAQIPHLAEFVPEALRMALASTVPTEPEHVAPRTDTDPEMPWVEADDDEDPLDDTAARPATLDEAKFRLDAQGVGFLPLGVPIPRVDTEDDESTLIAIERQPPAPRVPPPRLLSLQPIGEDPLTPLPSPWDRFLPADDAYVVPQDLEAPEGEEEITGEIEPIPLERVIVRPPMPRQASSDPGKG
jgi:hypothetical protein